MWEGGGLCGDARKARLTRLHLEADEGRRTARRDAEKLNRRLRLWVARVDGHEDELALGAQSGARLPESLPARARVARDLGSGADEEEVAVDAG